MLPSAAGAEPEESDPEAVVLGFAEMLPGWLAQMRSAILELETAATWQSQVVALYPEVVRLRTDGGILAANAVEFAPAFEAAHWKANSALQDLADFLSGGSTEESSAERGAYIDQRRRYLNNVYTTLTELGQALASILTSGT